MGRCIACSKEAMFRLKVFRKNGAKRRQREKRVRDERQVRKGKNHNITPSLDLKHRRRVTKERGQSEVRVRPHWGSGHVGYSDIIVVKVFPWRRGSRRGWGMGTMTGTSGVFQDHPMRARRRNRARARRGGGGGGGRGP